MLTARTISELFTQDLQKGVLLPLLEHVQRDDTLMLSIRKDYINIYYRGGSLLKLSENGPHRYSAHFDPDYNKTNQPLPTLPSLISENQHAKIWSLGIPALKGVMDHYFSQKPKMEREFQQLIARENNESTISNDSEYFITDIEFSNNDRELKCRFDMLGVQWLSTKRRKGAQCVPVIIEVKYGDNALTGSSGLRKHLDDLHSLLQDEEKRRIIGQTIESQFTKLDELGLLKYNKPTGFEMSVDSSIKPQVVLIFANHNPRSAKLGQEIDGYLNQKHDVGAPFDLKVFVSQFAGYGMHADCMMELEEFRKLLKP